jgi:hypothetical protein
MDRISYATVATACPDGRPWNSPVFCAVDEDYTVFWGSHVDSRHSRNIRANGAAFIVVYDSTVLPGQGEGVYIEATCQELTDSTDIARAHRLIQGRRPGPYWTLDEVHGDAPVRLYRATPSRIWMNGEGSVHGIYIDTRVNAEIDSSEA